MRLRGSWLAALVVAGALAGAPGCDGKKLCADGQAGCCHSTDDCGSASICFPPTGLGCIVQPPLPGTPTCHADSDCAGQVGPIMVCEQVSCDLSSGMSCRTGCMFDADCGEGATCAPTHHCGPSPCAGGCPPLFACDAVSAVCDRVTCAADADCPAHGVCVDQRCHATLGQCGLID